MPRRWTPEHDFVICPQFRIGDEVIRTISMVARFDTDELAIELSYPEDAAAERFFRELAQSRPAAEMGLVT